MNRSDINNGATTSTSENLAPSGLVERVRPREFEEVCNRLPVVTHGLRSSPTVGGRNPKHMDRLVTLPAALPLVRFAHIGDKHETAWRQPAQSFESAVLRFAFPGSGKVVDRPRPGNRPIAEPECPDPEARVLLRDDG